MTVPPLPATPQARVMLPIAPLGRLAALAALAVWISGCGPSAPAPGPAAVTHDHDEGHDDHDDHGHDHGHDDHDHPDTLAEGIAELAAAAAAVKAHLASGATDEADDVVHGVGHIIEDIQGLLPKENLSAEGRAAVSKALDEIFDCFDALDTALHAPAGQGKPPAEVHAGVAERIEAAVASLRAAR